MKKLTIVILFSICSQLFGMGAALASKSDSQTGSQTISAITENGGYVFAAAGSTLYRLTNGQLISVAQIPDGTPISSLTSSNGHVFVAAGSTLYALNNGQLILIAQIAD